MLLALDIGNSTIVAALFDGEKKLRDVVAPSSVQRTPEETWQIVESLLQETGVPATSLHAVGISSVVPFLTGLFVDLVRKRIQRDPLVINGGLDLGIRLAYKNPLQLGPDRICAAVAGYHKYGGPLLIIDFGTATTYGVIDAHGDFLGGAIGLGVKAAADALHSRTAQLPPIELRLPSETICTDTSSAMQAGIMFNAIDAVEGMIERLKNALHADARVVATGGLGRIMAPLIPSIEQYDPSLVLEGVRLLCERLARNRS
jgi:type III pantothenate kinase